MESKVDHNLWKCPLCKKKGISENVSLRQINDFNAIYCCDGSQCTYPLDVLKAFPIVNRHCGEIEVPRRQLDKLELGYIPADQKVRFSELGDLLEKDLVSRSTETILAVDKEWNDYLQRMKERGIQLPPNALNLKDPDLEKLSR